MTLTNFYINLYPLITEFFIFTIVCFLLIFGAVFSNSEVKNFPTLNKSINFLSLQTLFLSFILLVNHNPIFMLNWNNLLIFDSFAFYTKFILLILVKFWFVIFFNIKKNYLNFEFWILNLISLLSLFFIIQSYDLLSVYISVELLSLTFYVLASFKRNSEFSTEAGLKYFILGAFSSVLLLFGFSLIYSFTGLTNFQDFILFFAGHFYLRNNFLTLGILTGLFFIITAILFKLGVAPFHFWVPDVYEGAPTPITALFAILPKIALFGLIIRFFFSVFLDFLANYTSSFFLICTFLSSLLGTFGAFHQKKWKRFVAYSSISHLSFILVSLCSINLDNLNNLFCYLIFYITMTVAFFSFFSFFNTKKVNKIKNNRYLNSLNFLSVINPAASVSITIIFFSMAGIPPLIGFFIKFFVLFSVISNKFIGIAVAILVFNCVACFYYIKFIRMIYFNNNFRVKNLPITICIPYSTSLGLGILIFLMVFISFNFEFIFILTNSMCISFFY